MKKTLIIFFVILLFVARISYAMAIAESTVSVSAKATKIVEPDVAYIVIAVENKAKTPKEAMQYNNQKMNSVVKALNCLLDKNHGDKIETKNLKVVPEYSYKNNEKMLFGYNALNTVQVKTKNLSKASEIVATALENGANKLDSLQFQIEDCNKYTKELTIQSVQMAKCKADTIAQVLNESVAKVKTISTYMNNDNDAVYAMKSFQRMVGAEASPPTPIFPEKIILEATTNAEFYLK